MQPISLNDDVKYDEGVHDLQGHLNFYKPFLSCLTIEQARICHNIFHCREGSDIAYRNAKFGGFIYMRDLIPFYPDNWLTDWVCKFLFCDTVSLKTFFKNINFAMV